MSKILIVEDDRETADMLNMWLSSEHVVEQVSDGAEGFDRMTNYHYDVVVLDWNLPKMDGNEVCKQYRRKGGQTLIIMLTGKAQIADKEEGFNAGADDYLTKPFHPRELSARINALLRRQKDVYVPDALKVGDLEFSIPTKKASCQGQTVELSRKEAAILELLMRNPDCYFSASAMMERLWSAESESSPDVIRVHVTKMRAKLKSIGCGSYIQSTHGYGYKLSV